MSDVCGAKCELFKVACRLPAGHDGPHVYETPEERISWEPRPLAEVRRENERLRLERDQLREELATLRLRKARFAER